MCQLWSFKAIAKRTRNITNDLNEIYCVRISQLIVNEDEMKFVKVTSSDQTKKIFKGCLTEERRSK